MWAAITDIENASETMSGIQKIEVVEKPADGLAAGPGKSRLRAGRAAESAIKDGKVIDQVLYARTREP